ncbi:MAG: hypothetical protein J5985_01075 [Kiritimatiellae bacterium]|nr:hypothetical protein [Kiritimatiellia bacterium]
MKRIGLLLAAFASATTGFAVDGLGFPQPGAEKTLRADFKAPPPGYGEVPFWWWSGREPLNKERLLEQIEELHKAGIAGVQVNYAHYRTGTRPTQDSVPALFSDAWWEVFSFAARECAKRKMGISLSNYTLDFPEADNLWRKLGISTPDVRAKELAMRTKAFAGGKVPDFGPDAVAVIARRDGGDVSVLPVGGNAATLPSGKWTLYVFTATPHARTLDPLNAESGRRVVERFFNPFIEKVPEEARGALNYFFQDELILSRDILWLWSPDFADEFKKRKHYDIVPMLPALFTDWGPDTAKVRLDMNDVMSALSCERYYKPIYDWHASRGLIYGCDQATRGRHPMSKYIDYMRVMKYFTAPGFDTPGRSADIIKNKVGSSLAHLYRRPRVWLEGYHSQGWQASTSTIFDSTCHNYLYGANLLNLHGLYYSTYGGWWEWAPPCYHFRMPYWTYMKTFLKYFERLSYVLSQGAHVCDVAVVNPLEPCVYNRNRGNVSVGVSHDIVRRLVTEAQTDVDFIDADSLVRAVVKDGRLCVADEAYRLVILPDMVAIRASSLEKLAAFKRAGGAVVFLGETPKFTDAPHGEKAKVDALIAELTANGRTGGVTLPAKLSDAQLKALADSVGTPDFRAPDQAKALHRRIGGYDVYFICDLAATGECTFRSQGTPELWNPWDGSQKAFKDFKRNADGTTTVRVDGDGAPKLVVFAGDTASVQQQEVSRAAGLVPSSYLTLDGDWDFTLKPTMDNKWGDFRLPVRERYIGAEIRRVRMRGAQELNLPETMTVSYGPQFIEVDGRDEARPSLKPFLFSWREGVEGMPGFQDWHHGLNGIVGDDFFVLGPYSRKHYDAYTPTKGKQANRYIGEYRYDSNNPGKNKPGVYRYKTFVYAPCDCKAKPVAHGVVPEALTLDGKTRTIGEEVSLTAGYHELAVRYEDFGRAALVMMRTDVEDVPSKTPLSMRWFNNPAVLPFDPFGGKVKEGIYTATLPPACEEIEIRMRGTLVSANVAGAEAKVVSVADGIPAAAHEKIYRVTPRMPWQGVAALTLCVAHEPGFIGGAVFTEPLRLKCGKGKIALGNWAGIADGLTFYSGGAVYEKAFTLTKEQAFGTCILDLGGVGVCCGVSVNGEEEKVICCPPWRVEIGDATKAGLNTLKVTVYNTLNNHYQTIPTRYRTTVDNAPSGLLGPVKLEFHTK